MFEELRDSIRDLLAGRVAPEDRRAMMHAMRETLVRARLGVEDLQQGVSATRVRLNEQRKELETVQRRKKLATDINDAETVAIAEKYERQLSERVDILEKKLAVQEAELMMVEQEVTAMTADLKAARAGAGAVPASTAARDLDPLDEEGNLSSELDGLARAQRRSAHESDAEAKLAELKRRMGK